MHILTHALVALDCVDRKLTPLEKELLILGSMLPDISELGIGDEVRTHTEGAAFLKSLPLHYRYLGIGFILHGEKPHGLDYYTHHGFYAAGNVHKTPVRSSSNGYLARVYPEIAPIVHTYIKSFGHLPLHHAVHLVAEFCFDHITAQRNLHLLSMVRGALRANVSRTALLTFSHFFDISRKDLRRLLRICRSQYTGRFLSHFLTLEGTAHNFRNYIFFTSTRDGPTSRHALFKQIGAVARSSFNFLSTRIHERSLLDMFERCLPIVQRDYNGFLNETQSKLRAMLKSQRL